jgi:hypothetical protein
LTFSSLSFSVFGCLECAAWAAALAHMKARGQGSICGGRRWQHGAHKSRWTTGVSGEGADGEGSTKSRTSRRTSSRTPALDHRTPALDHRSRQQEPTSGADCRIPAQDSPTSSAPPFHLANHQRIQHTNNTRHLDTSTPRHLDQDKSRNDQEQDKTAPVGTPT